MDSGQTSDRRVQADCVCVSVQLHCHSVQRAVYGPAPSRARLLPHRSAKGHCANNPEVAAP